MKPNLMPHEREVLIQRMWRMADTNSVATRKTEMERILAAFDALREERDEAEIHGKKYHARHGHLLPFDGQACLVCRADALVDAVKKHIEECLSIHELKKALTAYETFV